MNRCSHDYHICLCVGWGRGGLVVITTQVCKQKHTQSDCVLLLSHVQLCDAMECSLPSFSVHEILQARIIKWVVMPSERESSKPRDQTQVIGRQVLYH